MEAETPANAYADAEKQDLWIVGSQDAVCERLKDADSAKFRNVQFYSGSGSPIVCGEVNARNGFGGFSGFERFIAKGPRMPAVLASDMASPREMSKAWAKLCVKAPSDQS